MLCSAALSWAWHGRVDKWLATGSSTRARQQAPHLPRPPQAAPAPQQSAPGWQRCTAAWSRPGCGRPPAAAAVAEAQSQGPAENPGRAPAPAQDPRGYGCGLQHSISLEPAAPGQPPLSAAFLGCCAVLHHPESLLALKPARGGPTWQRARSRSWTAARCPPSAALCMGVSPSLAMSSTSDCAASSSCTSGACPPAAAWCSGSQPSASLERTLHLGDAVGGGRTGL